MNSKLTELLGQIRQRGLTSQERDEQRRSFAYGSAHIENDRITRDTVVSAEKELRRESQNK